MTASNDTDRHETIKNILELRNSPVQLNRETVKDSFTRD